MIIVFWDLFYVYLCICNGGLEEFAVFIFRVVQKRLIFAYFLLQCIVIDFFLNNQSDAIIMQIYSVVKLYMFRASSLPIIMEVSTLHSALVSFMQVFDCRFQAESGWNYFHPDSAWKPAWNLPVPNVQQNTPWWLAEKMPETCRVL